MQRIKKINKSSEVKHESFPSPQEPRALYDDKKIVPLSKLDRAVTDVQVKKAIEEEEAKLPSHLVVSWPEGDEVSDGEKRRAGRTIGKALNY